MSTVPPFLPSTVALVCVRTRQSFDVVCVCHQVDLVQRVRMHTKRVRLATWLKNGKNEKYRWQNGTSH